jgi:hypothetical protein
MNKWRWILSIIVSLIIGFIAGLLIKYCYETRTFKPYRWKDAPIIVNCYGDDFNEPQLTRGIEYWEHRGQSISFYEMNPGDKICENTYIHGFIILRKATTEQLNEPTLALTQRYTSGLEMSGAVIYFSSGSQNLTLIIEHELGHALGFSHVGIEGHIMHPIWEKMGRDFYVP